MGVTGPELSFSAENFEIICCMFGTGGRERKGGEEMLEKASLTDVCMQSTRSKYFVRES